MNFIPRLRRECIRIREHGMWMRWEQEVWRKIA